MDESMTSEQQVSEEEKKRTTGGRSLDSTQSSNTRYSRQVYSLVTYFMLMLLFSFWYLFDVWSENFAFMRLLNVNEKALAEPLLRTINFTIVGGFFGSILFHIRELFDHYARRTDYDPRWVGKYITGPWEGAAMSMVVLSLIRGGVALFGGSMGTDVTGASNFAAFGVGALVGFGMRDVVGWLDNLVQTMFTIRQQERADGLTTQGTNPPRQI